MHEVKALFKSGIVAHLFGYSWAVAFLAVHYLKVLSGGKYPVHFALANLHPEKQPFHFWPESHYYKSIYPKESSLAMTNNSSKLLAYCQNKLPKTM